MAEAVRFGTEPTRRGAPTHIVKPSNLDDFIGIGRSAWSPQLPMTLRVTIKEPAGAKNVRPSPQAMAPCTSRSSRRRDGCSPRTKKVWEGRPSQTAAFCHGPPPSRPQIPPYTEQNLCAQASVRLLLLPFSPSRLSIPRRRKAWTRRASKSMPALP